MSERRMTLLNLDCLQVLKEMREVQCIFADPPDAIGLKYNSYKDTMTASEYQDFIRDLIEGVMHKCSVFWMSYNAKHTFMMGRIVDHFMSMCPEWEAKPFVQTYTFGQHCQTDCGNCHRPLVRLMKKGTILYPDAIRVPSWRQKNGDKRADPRGRVPGDVFDIPRVTGNSRQRRRWHPTQLNEDLYERCIKSCCVPGDTVCDLFAGTGTLARVAKRCGVNALLVEIDPLYCSMIAAEHNLEYDND